ncbi:MAG: DUF899 family protein [candidate division Zixibacteria bacterium]|nr:DUF899 family protein [candidate division Zixibacteria bacterium]
MTTVSAQDVTARIAAMEKEMLEKKKELTELRRQAPPEEVKEYTFTSADGSKETLAELFGEKDELILIHNMGKRCSFCTLWADGFIGITGHMEDRVGFALISFDPPDVMKEFTKDRGWTFKYLSAHGTTFSKDMGFASDKGDPQPGVSSFRKDDNGKITRVAHTSFGPGDDFCSVWSFLDLLPEGARGWQPKFSYN